MNLSELIRRYGDENVQCQMLDQCADSLDMRNGITHIKFGTPQPIDMRGTVKMGLILWMDRDRVAEIREASKKAESPDDAESLAAERKFLAEEARRYASHYPQSSDGRNTFILFAEMIEARAAKSEA